MTQISISKLKTNPSGAIASAAEYPVAIQNRNKTQAYLLGSELFEKLIAYLEDYSDTKEVAGTDLNEVRDFEEVAKELGI